MEHIMGPHSPILSWTLWTWGGPRVCVSTTFPGDSVYLKNLKAIAVKCCGNTSRLWAAEHSSSWENLSPALSSEILERSWVPGLCSSTTIVPICLGFSTFPYSPCWPWKSASSGAPSCSVGGCYEPIFRLDLCKDT